MDRQLALANNGNIQRFSQFYDILSSAQFDHAYVYASDFNDPSYRRSALSILALAIITFHAHTHLSPKRIIDHTIALTIGFELHDDPLSDRLINYVTCNLATDISLIVFTFLLILAHQRMMQSDNFTPPPRL